MFYKFPHNPSKPAPTVMPPEHQNPPSRTAHPVSRLPELRLGLLMLLPVATSSSGVATLFQRCPWWIHDACINIAEPSPEKIAA
jgi:hypothetical protein